MARVATPALDCNGSRADQEAMISNDSDQAWQGYSQLGPLPASRRRWPWFVLIVILALACVTGAYA
jgi:hypothetical protein